MIAVPRRRLIVPPRSRRLVRPRAVVPHVTPLLSDETMSPGIGTPPNELPEAADLWLWLEAGEDPTTSGLSDGAAVTTWEDLHTTNHDVTQGNAANKPIYKTNILNGHSIVRFDGSNDNLQNEDNPNLNDRTLIAVIAMAASPVNTRNSVLFVSTITNAIHFMARNTNANGNVVGIRNNTTEFNTDDVLPTDGSSHIVSWTMNPAAGGPSAERARIWIDGLLQADLANTLPDTGATVAVNIGAGTAGSAFKGDIAALAFYHNNIAESSIEAVERYFADKYDLSYA